MRYFLLLSILSYGFQKDIHAQTVTIQNVNVPIQYIQLPYQPLPATYTTYNTIIDIPYSVRTKSQINTYTLDNEFLRLEGYEKSSGKGDIEIKGQIGDYNNWGEYPKTRSNKVKNKDGTTSTKVSYYMEIRYSLPIGFSVKSKDGKRLAEEDIYTNSDIRTWESQTYSSRSALDAYWRTSETRQIGDLQERLIKEGFKKIKERINYLFGYQVVTDHVKFETIGKKRHPLYEDFDKNAKLIKSIFSEVRATSYIKDFKPRFDPIVKFYQTQDDKITGRSKDEDKLRHIVWYNLGLIYFWTEDLRNAEMYAEKILKIDPGDKDAKRLIKDIQEMQYLYEKNGRTTRYKVKR